jgi:hypothetical protein
LRFAAALRPHCDAAWHRSFLQENRTTLCPSMAKLRVAENILLKGMIAAPQSVYLQVLPCRPSLVLQRRLPLPASAAALDSGVAWASVAKAGKAVAFAVIGITG